MCFTFKLFPFGPFRQAQGGWESPPCVFSPYQQNLGLTGVTGFPLDKEKSHHNSIVTSTAVKIYQLAYVKKLA